MKRIANVMLGNIGNRAYALLLFLLVPVPLYANAGIPTIVVSYPLMLIALIPIIFIEALFFAAKMEVKFKSSLIALSVSNAVTTILGIPLNWLLLFLFELLVTGGSCGPGFDNPIYGIITVVVEAAWFCPWEHELFDLLAPLAFITNFVTAFFISVFVESKIHRKFYKDLEYKKIKTITRQANIISYGILSIVVIIVYYIVI